MGKQRCGLIVRLHLLSHPVVMKDEDVLFLRIIMLWQAAMKQRELPCNGMMMNPWMNIMQYRLFRCDSNDHSDRTASHLLSEVSVVGPGGYVLLTSPGDVLLLLHYISLSVQSALSCF